MHTNLQGKLILVVEDGWLIATDIATAFEEAGAKTLVANRLRPALDIVASKKVTAAVIDHGLPDGDSEQLRQRLEGSGVPVVLYTGFEMPAKDGAIVISKPAPATKLVNVLAELLSK